MILGKVPKFSLGELKSPNSTIHLIAPLLPTIGILQDKFPLKEKGLKSEDPPLLAMLPNKNL